MQKTEKIASFLGKEKIAGIDINDGNVRAAYATLNTKGKVVINQLGSLEYSPTASDDEIASVVKQLWRKQHIKTHTVYSCLHSPSLLLKHFKYDNLDAKEVESALLLEAEQLFQKEPEDLFIDWHLYPPSQKTASTDRDNQHPEGILVAALAKDVNRHLGILEKAGLYPVAVDVGCMAISNLFLALNSRLRTENVCLVNLDRKSADIAVLCDDSHIYPSNIYSRTNTWKENTEYLINHIVDVLRYHQYKLHKEPIIRVVFTGTLSSDIQMQHTLKKSIEVPVEFWDPLESSDIEKGSSLNKKEINGPSMAACLGLALRRE